MARKCSMKQESVLNGQRRELPGPQLLHDLVSTPDEDAVALDFLFNDGNHLTVSYSDFYNTSHRLAKCIRRKLPRQHVDQIIIPVIIPQSPELYVAWRGVLLAGAGFCPVSTDVPPERLKFIVKDVSAPMVLILKEQADKIRETLPDLPCLEVSLDELKLDNCNGNPNKNDRINHETELSHSIKPSDPAYVMYTSGSTGLPKGVQVSHYSATQSLLAHDEHIPKFKRFLQFASPTFDVSIFEVFFPFFRGATLVGCERERLLSDLPGSIIALDADAAELTPTVAGTLLRTRAAAPCLKTLLTIGEMLTKQVITEFGGSDEQESMLYAMYGPTEASIHCTLAPRLASSSSVRNIGKPLSTVTAFVLKETNDINNLEIASIGEAGELAVAGQLADGYLNRPDQNNAAFVSFGSYGEIYRTGDRAITNSDGYLEILGRMSSGQVKLRGQRVELGEIEEVASKHSGVHLAIAIVVEDVLILFCATDESVTSMDIQSVCKSWLPTFMRPGEIILMEEIPRLPSGKIDRKSLEADYQSRKLEINSGSRDFVNDEERKLVEAFQTELSCTISRDAPIWSSGLDSLKAIKIASKLRDDFSSISVSMIVESETISDLAKNLATLDKGQELDNQSKEDNDPENWDEVQQKALESLRALGETQRPTRIVPCSNMQIAMLTETSAHSKLNFNLVSVELGEHISRQGFWNALQKVACQNEILRSGFIYTGETDIPFVQVVWPDLEQHKLSLQRPLQLVEDNNDNENSATLWIHHALYDGWSWELILDDINTTLSSQSLPERPPFCTFRCYQNMHASMRSEEDMNHWNSLLQDLPSAPMPNLNASSAQEPTRESITQALEVSYDRLSNLSEELRISRQSVFQAAWAMLLASYVDSEDVLFGTVSSGRHAAVKGIDQIIGPCLSTLPSRVDLSSVDTYHDLVSYIQRQHLDALKYGNVSLHDIQKSLCNNTSKALFDTLLVWQEGEKRSPDQRKFAKTKATFDALEYICVLEIEPLESNIVARATIDTTVLPVQQAKLMLSQLGYIVSHMVSNMDQKIQRNWNSAGEHLTSIANKDYSPFDESFDLLTTITRLADSDPSKPAVNFIKDFDPESGQLSMDSLSYADLFSNAKKLSAALIRSHNIKPDALVCVLAERSINLYISILAVIISGAGYMCIDPRTPPERIEQILKEATCEIVMIDNTISVTELQIKTSFVQIEHLLTESADQSVDTPRPNQNDHLAYAVFTSGSTGVPKGVLLTRRNLLSNIQVLSQIYPSDPDQGQLLQSCSPAFDVSVFEIFWTWHMGMTLCTASNDVLFRGLEQFVRATGITHLSMTPSVAALIQPENVPSVKFLVTAGEPMNQKVFKSWVDHGLYQGYGPSETTNICNVRPEVRKGDASNNVGPAFPNTSIFLCRRQDKDKQDVNIPLSANDLQLVPKGAVGEIWVGGEQVGRGYIDPLLSARSFFNHPEYGYIYRSGDIGRLLADESLVILGREDDQVKLRGQRVELGDINAALISHKSTKDAVTLVITESGKNARLVAFWSPHEWKSNDLLQSLTSDHFRYIETRLPSYMVPDAVVPVQKVPLTRQGKVDKRLLEQQYRDTPPEQLQVFSRQSGKVDDGRALNMPETKVAKVFAESLDVPIDSIKHNTSFYALGLDSINCIRFSQNLKRAGYAQLDVSKILRHASVASLSQLLNGQSESNSETSIVSTAATFYKDDAWTSKIRASFEEAGFEVEKILPCTPLQEYMLSASSAAQDETVAYENTLKFNVSGDLKRLERAWKTAQTRQSLLRTSFVSLNSAEIPYAQVVLKEISMAWNDETLQQHDNIDNVLILRPYSLRTESCRNGTVNLVLQIHHALYDAEAMSVLLDEVQLLYVGKEVEPSPPFERYLDYMVQMDTKTTDEFWKKELGGHISSKLADVLPIRSRQEDFVSHVCLKSSLRLKELEENVRRQSTTILALLQSAMARLLYCYFNTKDVIFGNVFSGRNLSVEDAERIVGPCFNTLPVRAQIQQNASNHDLCRALQNLNISTIPFQPSSLRRIQKQNSKDGRPLFDVLILLQKGDVALNEDIWQLVEEDGDMSFPYILEVTPQIESMDIELKLHSQSSTQEVLREILQNFDALLVHTAQYPQARACDFSVIKDKIPQLKERGKTGPQSQEGPKVGENLSDLEAEVGDILLNLSSIERPKITKNTTIFRLGLDSINAVQVAAQLRKHGYLISRSDILEAPSIAEIASLCASRNSTPTSEIPHFDFEAFSEKHLTSVIRTESLNENEIEMIRPCTPVQCGIISQFLKSQGKMYYNCLRLCLQDDVDLERLKDAWNSAISRHEMLRTGFAEVDDAVHPYAMIVYTPGSTDLSWTSSILDITGSPPPLQPIFPNQQRKLSVPLWNLHYVQKGTKRHLDVSMHHALYDAQSLDVILADVTSIYSGLKLPEPVSIQHALSSILNASKSDSESAKEFWTGMVNKISPTKFPDMKVYHHTEITSSVVTRKASLQLSTIQKQCTDLGTSLQGVCQVAWAKLLAAYTGQDSVTFGLTLSGRTFDDNLNDVAFPCLTTVPCAVQISDDNERLLDEIATQNKGLAKHQHTPLTRIKQWIQIEEALFDTILVLQKFRSRQVNDKVWRAAQDQATAEYTISVEIMPNETSDDMKLQITYDERLVPPEAARMILDQLDMLLTIIVGLEGKSTSQSMLSVLPPKDQRIQTDVRFLHELVEKSADARPQRIALEYVTNISDDKVFKQTWTYAELDQAGNRIANALVKKDIKPGSMVAICFDKCPEASFAILGVLKAGCAFVAVDPGAPEARKEFILKDAGCACLLTTKDKIETFDFDDNKILAVDNRELLENLPAEKPSISEEFNSSYTCYCLYTSGTTGTPKGCLISHESAVQAMLSFQRIFNGRWNDNSRWLQFASFHFDVSVLEQYWSWSVGICMTSAPRDLLFEDLPGFIRKLEITHLDLTPSLARLLSPEDVPSLCNGVFIVGGEQVSQDILETWGDTSCLYNFYGPSEVTIGCTVHPRVPKNAKPTNIGQQWDNAGTFVLKPKTQSPVLRGSVGELCLSGPLVGKGYLNRPDLTDEKFVVLKDFDTRVYRTGDLVRLLHDKSFEFLGRIDDQVKLRGQRLEIGEINHVIMGASKEIKNTATMVLKHQSQAKEQLIAFYSVSHGKKTKSAPVIVQDSTTLDAKIREHCTDKLPGYMVPTSIFQVSHMPLSANNKVEHKILKSMYEETSLDDIQSSSLSRNTFTEEDERRSEELISILQEFLHLPKDSVRPDSRLFELGLDSISVIGLSRMFKAKGFADADVATIMRNSVVVDLARNLSKSREGNSQGSKAVSIANERIENFSDVHIDAIIDALNISESAIESIAPCTPLQEAMISKAMSSDFVDPVYFTQFNYDIHKKVNLEQLREAWRIVRQYTSILRTYFVPTEEGYAQVVLREGSGIGHDPIEEENAPTSKQPFKEWWKAASNFGKTIPWRLRISHTWGKTYMSLFIFHGLYDGISLDLLLQRVAKAYNNPKSAPNLSNFYDILPNGPLRREEGAQEFWSTTITEVKMIDLDKQHPRRKPGTPSPRPLRLQLELPGLDKLCNRLNITTPAIFHAAWLYVLHQTYGINPTIGLVVSGRAVEHEEAETALGPMFNTIPCTIEGLSDANSILDLAQACHKFNIDALPFQNTPLRDIAKWTSHDLRKGLFDSLLVYQKQQKHPYTHQLWHNLPSDTNPDYPLNLEIEQQSTSQFVLTLVTKEEYFSANDAHSLIEELSDTIHRLDNGDKFLLPGAFKTVSKRLRSSTPPANSEETIAEAEEWTIPRARVREQLVELASVEADSIHINHPTIFELGLDSIDALKLATRLKAVGMKVAVSKIMRFPTVAGIESNADIDESKLGDNNSNRDTNASTWIDDLQSESVQLLRSTRYDKDDFIRILPVTPMQEGLLVDFDTYYNVMTFKLNEDVDVSRLLEAWKAIGKEQPILRTRFISIENLESEHGFVQAVGLEEDNDSWIQVYPEKKPQDIMAMFKEEATQTGMDILTIRVAIAREFDGQPYLILGMPHAAYDAWSLRLLHQAVARSYALSGSIKNGNADSTGIPYEEHLETILRSANRKEIESFWSETLQNTRPSFIEMDAAPGDEIPAQLIQHMSKVSLQSATDFCKRGGITLQSLGLACWTLTLAHYLKQADVCFGLVLSGRTTEGSDQLIFPTFNTVLFRLLFENDESTKDFLRKVHDLAMNASEHQHFALREAVKIARTKDGAPELFNSLFTFQKQPQSSEDMPLLYEETILEDVKPNPPYPINIEMESSDGHIRWTVASQEGFASDTDLRSVLSTIDHILDFIIENPNEKVVENAEGESSICGLPSITFKTLSTATSEIEKKSIQDHETALWSHNEEAIRDVLAQVSKTDANTIQKDTGFFNLGLDSISAIKVSGLLKKEGIKLPVSAIIKAQTIEKMAGAVKEVNDKEEPVRQKPVAFEQDLSMLATELEKHAIDREDVEEILQVNSGQMYMLTTWAKSDGKLFYPSFWLDVKGISKSELEKAVTKLSQRLPLLRTLFICCSKPQNYFRQIIIKSEQQNKYKFPWIVDVQGQNETLFLTLKLHHALYDAVSLQIMVSELQKLCNNRTSGSMYTSFSEFISLTQALDSSNKAQQREFWTKYLSSAQSGNGISNKARFSSARTEKYVPSVLITTKLDPSLKSSGISIQSLFIAIYARIHSRILSLPANSPKELVLGIYLANRSLDLDHLPTLAAPTFNIVPLKVSVSGETSIIKAARQVQRDLGQISTAENCGVSLHEIHEWTGVTVNGVVNFLKLPGEDFDSGSDLENKDLDGEKNEDRVTIHHADPETKESFGVTRDKSTLDSPSPFINTFDIDKFGEWCLPSIDIEAKINPDDSLGVGVFAPSDLLSEDDVERIYEELKMGFDDVMGENEDEEE